ncbi:MAG: Na/Pi cotransporter family protein [Candidatus Paceibacterota bacterium]|jgi:phosphate:Na+ symporter|nr:Na/Pi cotransporter family protein [Candidatus Paceibacterota bacterium]
MNPNSDTSRSATSDLKRHFSGSSLFFKTYDKGKRILPLFVIGAFLFYLIKEARSFKDIDILGMSVSLLAGLSIFLYGMSKMESSLNRLAGSRVKKMLETATEKKLSGLATGAAVTALVGSSSITTVILINLVGTSILSFARSVPVIFGTNIGSTVTLQLLAFNVDAIIPYFLVGGFFLLFINKNNKKWQSVGNVVFGLALIFFGLSLMKTAMIPLKTFPPFGEIMMNMENPFFGMFVGFIFAGLIQSSAGTVAVVIALAANGLVTLPAGIALILGVHIGKCSTAFLAGIGKNGLAARVVVATTIFAVSSSLVFIFFIPELAYAVQWVGGSVPRQIANAHTIFNVIAALAFLPFTETLTAFVERTVPARRTKEEEESIPKYLRSEEEIHSPLGVYFGLLGVKQELHRMGEIVLSMYDDVLKGMLHGTEEELEKIANRDDSVDALYDHIYENILVIRLADVTEEQLEIINKLERFGDELERAGDTVKRLAHYGTVRAEKGLEISEGTQQKITEMHNLIHEQFLRLLNVISGVMSKEERMSTEKEIIDERNLILKRSDEIIGYLQRIRGEGERPFRLEAFKVERDMLRYMARVYKKIHHMASLHLSNYAMEREDEEDESSGSENDLEIINN